MKKYDDEKVEDVVYGKVTSSSLAILAAVRLMA